MENIRNNFGIGENEESKKNPSEKLDLKIELATPEDWEQCKKIRTEALQSEDVPMLGDVKKMLRREEKKGQEDWEKELSSKTMFTVLSKSGVEPIGIGRAKQQHGEIWILYNGYVKKDFQGKGIGKKIFAARLDEIIKRGGKRARTAIKFDNDPSMQIAKDFGFKIKDPLSASIAARKIIAKKWKILEADLSDPEVVKKINTTLNAR